MPRGGYRPDTGREETKKETSIKSSKGVKE